MKLGRSIGERRVDAYLIVAAEFVETRGMERANLELARYVANRGHDVHLVAHHVSPELARLPRVHTHQVARPLSMSLLGERCLDAVGRRLAKRLPPGTRIIANGGNCSVFGINWIHYVHRSREAAAADETLRGCAFRTLAEWSEGRAVAKAKLLIANSEKTRIDLLASYSRAPPPIEVVHCGLDSSRFHPVSAAQRRHRAESLGFRPEDLRLVFVGGFPDDRKGFGVLFEAIRAVRFETQDLEVVVVGSGRQLPNWMRRTREAGLERIHFLGHRPDVAEILQASDLLVAPSRYESYGLNIAEAMATGLPVIASRASGASVLVTGKLRELLLNDPQSGLELGEKLRMWRAERGAYSEAAVVRSSAVRAQNWNAMSVAIYGIAEAAYRL